MKLSEFKREVDLRLTIIKTNTIFSFGEGTAYVYNNWGGLASTFTYMLTYLIFLSAIYGRVDNIAGYNYSEMLFFTLVIQLNFYATWIWSINNITQMGRDVNSGKMDLILSKPLPALWYVSFQKVNFLMFFFHGLPALIPLLYLMVKNSDYTITVSGFVFGIISLVLGHIATHCFHFMLGLIVFWTGQNKAMVGFGHKLIFFGKDIPLEAYPQSIFFLGLTVVPFLAHTALASSYFLGYTTDWSWLGLVLLVSVVFLWGKIKLWKLALNRYSSASS